MSIDVDAVLQDSKPTAAERKRITELEAQVEQLERQLHRARKPRLRINPAKIRQKHGSQFTRVIIPDTHGCFLDADAAAAFFADLEILQPREIVMLGDHLDCGGFLAQHHTLGYVAETEYSYEDDIAAANRFLDQVQQTCPDASIDYLYGNHEERVENWCITQTMRNRKDAERMRLMNSPEHVLSLESRGIRWYRSQAKYDGLSAPGTIKRGFCHFTHGHKHGKHGKHAAQSHVTQFGANVVFGHIHRIQSHTIRTVGGGISSGWSVGCLSQLQPLYQRRNQTDWAHGYGVQFCLEDGRFTHITVHIIDGESLFIPLVQATSAVAA